MADVIPGTELQDVSLSGSLTADDMIIGYRQPTGGASRAPAGSERRYPGNLFMGGGAGGGYLLPETYGAVGNANLGGTITDDTGAFNLLMAAAQPGDRIWLDPRKCYAVTGWTITKDNLRLESACGAGPQNILQGLTGYSNAAATMIIGSATAQLRRFRMQGVRVYSQNRSFGVFIRNLAYGRFDDCEIGGFLNYWLKISATGGGTYYVRINNSTFFGVAGCIGNGIETDYGTAGAGEFVAAVSLSGCDVDGGAPTSSAFNLLSVGDKVDLYLDGNTWFTCQDGKANIDILGTGRLVGGNAMIDGPDPGDGNGGTGTLIEYPGSENTVNSYLIGQFRINGFGKAKTSGIVRSMKGINNFGRSFLYGPKLYRPDIVGRMQLIDTGDTADANSLVNKPQIYTTGGPPAGGDPQGSLFISRNNNGSSETGFFQTSGGPENIVTGGYIDQVGPNIAMTTTTADLSGYKGNYCHLTAAGHNLVSLGTPTTGKRQNVYIEFQDACTVVHSTAGTGGVIFVQGKRANVNLINGDVALVHSYGTSWRLVTVWTVDGRAL